MQTNMQTTCRLFFISADYLQTRCTHYAHIVWLTEPHSPRRRVLWGSVRDPAHPSPPGLFLDPRYPSSYGLLGLERHLDRPHPSPRHRRPGARAVVASSLQLQPGMLRSPAYTSFCVLSGYGGSQIFRRTLGIELACSPRSGLGPGRSAAHPGPQVDAVWLLSQTPSLTGRSRPSAQSSAPDVACVPLAVFFKFRLSLYPISTLQIL